MNFRSVFWGYFAVGLAVFLCLPGCRRSAPASADTVRMWHWLTDREETLESLARQFEKETGISVKLELYAPSDAYAAKVRAAAQTRTLPDIFGVLGESRDLASYIRAGHIANLEADMALDKSAWRRQFFPKALAGTTFAPSNHYDVPPGIYGVPIDVTNIQMLYNKDLFRKAGLDPERPPQTWNDFIQAGHKLKSAGIPGLVSGWGENWLIECFASNYAFNVMGEQKVLDTFRGKVAYTDPDWIRVFSLFDQLRKEDLLASGIVTMVNKTAEQTFANGRAAFAFNGSWCVNVYRGMNPELSFAAMLPPRANLRRPMKIWGGAGTSFAVNAESRRRAQAVQFLRWLTEAPQQAVLSTETHNLPANRSSVGSLPPALASFAERMDDTTHPTQWPVTENPLVTEALTKGIQSILIGEQTPAQAAESIERVKRENRR